MNVLRTMKLFPFLFMPAALAVNAAADNATIREACHRQAVAMTQQLKAEIFTNMERSEIDHVIRIANQQCQRQFMSTPVEQAVANTDETDNKNPAGDWFSDYILNGEPPDKAGNRRLERMRHK